MLIACRECRKEIAETAKNCPQCGVKKPGHRRWRGWRIAGYTVLGLFLLGLVNAALLSRRPKPVSAAKAAPAASVAAPNRRGAELLITVKEKQYNHGYLKISGTVANVGDLPAEKPWLRVRIYDVKDSTLLANHPVYPVDHMIKPLSPRDRVAFEALVRVPGDPMEISWDVKAIGHPSETKIQRP